jgi:hypothetical protein
MKRKLISALAFLITATGICAQQPADGTPKLVITIVADQLRSDYLQYFRPTFGKNGFRRLMDEGLAYYHVDFGFPTGQTPSVATLFTGAYPCHHGITAGRRMDFEHLREVSILADDAFLGNYTDDRLSPAALLSSTITDELKTLTGGEAAVYAIAPNAEEAILSAGKYGDAAFWLDNYSGNWATTTYYKNIPWCADIYNVLYAPNKNSDLVWTPALSAYNALPVSKHNRSFNHTIDKNDLNRFAKLKKTPFINTEITRLANFFLEYAAMGKRNAPDFLSLTCYAGEYTPENSHELRWEIQDAYYRLDREIANLLAMAEKTAGAGNVLVALVSTGYYDHVMPPEEPAAREFYPNRCTALLNMYLMAIYGDGNWVKGYYNGQIYLNKQLIDDRLTDRDEMLRKTAVFLMQFSGVQNVTAAGQNLADDARRSAHRNTSGDLHIELQPGWKTMQENQTPNLHYRQSSTVLAPLILWGANIRPASIYRKINATEIAPTLAFLLRIRPPEACRETPLEEVLQMMYP